MNKKLTQAERRRAYYMKLWGLEENKSHTDDSGLTNQHDHDPNYLEKNKKIKEIRKNRKSFVNCFGCEIFYDE